MSYRSHRSTSIATPVVETVALVVFALAGLAFCVACGIL